MKGPKLTAQLTIRLTGELLGRVARHAGRLGSSGVPVDRAAALRHLLELGLERAELAPTSPSSASSARTRSA